MVKKVKKRKRCQAQGAATGAPPPPVWCIATPVVVTSNGKPVAAVVSIDQLRSLEQARLETLSEAIRRARSGVNVNDLQGPDPWANVRDPSTGRNVDLD